MLSLLKRFGAPFSRAVPPPDPGPTSSIVAPPTVTWPDRLAKTPLIAMRCPNCGSRARKPLNLTVNFATPDHPMRHSRVLRCPDCTCFFYEDQNPPDYTEESMLGRGRVTFYLQQGAGVSLITRPLAQVRKPEGSKYLEVGCGFGFGLDFAIRTRKWVGTGIDPAQISALGRDLLDVPIELRYLGDDEPEYNATCDVVMASETIEHVPSPIAFVRTLKRALKPGGILILTTPNAEELTEEKAQGMLVPLLSPGLHLVFQNRHSLLQILEKAGFSQIVMGTDGVSLVAFASEEPFTLESDETRLRAIYRDHLEQRARLAPPASDLFFAFAGRALQESVNDGDMTRAARAGELLQEAARTRYGFDFETIETLPEEAQTCSLERLAELMPLNLGGTLYSDAIRRLTAGTPRPALRGRFACAAAAADAMRRALGQLAMEDGMSEDISWTAKSEALLCAAQAGAPDIVALLKALPPAPGGVLGEGRRVAVVERLLASLVNSGHYALGRAVAVATGMETAEWANPPDAPAEPWRTQAAHPDDPTPPERPPLPKLTDTRRDALFCLAMIDVQPPDPLLPESERRNVLARGIRRFEHLREIIGAPTQGGSAADLYWEAVRGEMQAVELTRDLEILDATLLGRLDGFEAAGLTVPRQVRALDERLRGERVVTLVNAGQYDAARRLAAPLNAAPSAPGAPLTPGQRDALFCLAVLDVLQAPPDLPRAQRRFAEVRTTLAPRGAWPAEGGAVPGIYWAALRGEIQALTLEAGWETAEARRRSVLAVLGLAEDDVPEDLRVPIEPPPEPPAVEAPPEQAASEPADSSADAR